MSDTFRKAYRPLTDGEATAVEEIKTAAETIEAAIKRVQGDIPHGPRARLFSLAMTNLEQAVMWGVKGVSF